MRVVSIDTTQLVIHNNCTSVSQERWAAAVLCLGIICIHFLVSNVIDNIIYLWAAILTHLLSLMLVYWYFSPVKTTFHKIKHRLYIENPSFFGIKVNEYSISEIMYVQLDKIDTINKVSKIYLVLKSQERLYLSNSWDDKKHCQEVLEIIKKFISL